MSGQPMAVKMALWQTETVHFRQGNSRKITGQKEQEEKYVSLNKTKLL
jgi:hypothetical protein